MVDWLSWMVLEFCGEKWMMKAFRMNGNWVINFNYWNNLSSTQRAGYPYTHTHTHLPTLIGHSIRKALLLKNPKIYLHPQISSVGTTHALHPSEDIIDKLESLSFANNFHSQFTYWQKLPPTYCWKQKICFHFIQLLHVVCKGRPRKWKKKKLDRFACFRRTKETATKSKKICENFAFFSVGNSPLCDYIRLWLFWITFPLFRRVIQIQRIFSMLSNKGK